MPVCLTCGWEIVFGPAGCACTQKRKRERKEQETEELIERLKKIFPPKEVEPKSKLSKRRKEK